MTNLQKLQYHNFTNKAEKHVGCHKRHWLRLGLKQSRTRAEKKLASARVLLFREGIMKELFSVPAGMRQRSNRSIDEKPDAGRTWKPTHCCLSGKSWTPFLKNIHSQKRSALLQER